MDLGLNTFVSGLNAQSRAVDVAAQNTVNVNSTGVLEGDGQQAYIPQDIDFISQNPGGVRTEVKPRDPAFVPAYAPDDLSANADGYVAAPDINLAEEQMNLIRAETAYKATASLIPVIKDMYEELINAVDKNA